MNSGIRIIRIEVLSTESTVPLLNLYYSMNNLFVIAKLDLIEFTY